MSPPPNSPIPMEKFGFDKIEPNKEKYDGFAGGFVMCPDENHQNSNENLIEVDIEIEPKNDKLLTNADLNDQIDVEIEPKDEKNES